MPPTLDGVSHTRSQFADSSISPSQSLSTPSHTSVAPGFRFGFLSSQSVQSPTPSPSRSTQGAVSTVTVIGLMSLSMYHQPTRMYCVPAVSPDTRTVVWTLTAPSPILPRPSAPPVKSSGAVPAGFLGADTPEPGGSK